mmetsp:Transcript_10529/g.22624  ORF Transcript_10529/g.22624 Transcript_10529/m.22624 type:complete len:444 (+) Transcript_10529:324-1655(+)
MPQVQASVHNIDVEEDSGSLECFTLKCKLTLDWSTLGDSSEFTSNGVPVLGQEWTVVVAPKISPFKRGKEKVLFMPGKLGLALRDPPPQRCRYWCRYTIVNHKEAGNGMMFVGACNFGTAVDDDSEEDERLPPNTITKGVVAWPTAMTTHDLTHGKGWVHGSDQAMDVWVQVATSREKLFAMPLMLTPTGPYLVEPSDAPVKMMVKGDASGSAITKQLGALLLSEGGGDVHLVIAPCATSGSQAAGSHCITLPAHSHILVARSDYFASFVLGGGSVMNAKGSNDSGDAGMNAHGSNKSTAVGQHREHTVDPKFGSDTMKQVLTYIYTDEVDLRQAHEEDPHTVLPALMDAGRCYGVHGLFEACLKLAERSISARTAMAWAMYGNLNGLPELVELALSFMAKDMTAVENATSKEEFSLFFGHKVLSEELVRRLMPTVSKKRRTR